jgi:ferric-dicitrate binding protein FerR (iron transport regulator)
MSILTRPRPPRVDEPADAEALEALIEEARRRARRRRRGYAAAALAAAAVGLLGFYGLSHGGGATRARRTMPTRHRCRKQRTCLHRCVAGSCTGTT